MTREQHLKKLGTRLTWLRSELRRRISLDYQPHQNEMSFTGDALDLTVESESVELQTHLAELESDDLASTEVAIERLRAGRYGICESCQGAIPLKRLDAIPYALLCQPCQAHTELNHSCGETDRPLVPPLRLFSTRVDTRGDVRGRTSGQEGGLNDYRNLE